MKITKEQVWENYMREDIGWTEAAMKSMEDYAAPLLAALNKIAQCSDCGSYEDSIIYMKNIAAKAIEQYKS